MLGHAVEQLGQTADVGPALIERTENFQTPTERLRAVARTGDARTFLQVDTRVSFSIGKTTDRINLVEPRPAADVAAKLCSAANGGIVRPRGPRSRGMNRR